MPDRRNRSYTKTKNPNVVEVPTAHRVHTTPFSGETFALANETSYGHKRLIEDGSRSFDFTSGKGILTTRLS